MLSRSWISVGEPGSASRSTATSPSIWPADREIPAGWRKAGKQGKKAECLTYINEVWTDMRPLSLRKWMAEQEAKKTEAEPGLQVQPAAVPPAGTESSAAT